MPYAMTANGNTYYLACDQVGTLRLVTDTAGVAIKQIDYDSFGNIIVDTNPSFTIPFGYAGGLHDRDTGLVRFGYRDYMPKIGKWTVKDPIGFAGGDSNLYGYVLNDPINFFDPLGLMRGSRRYRSSGRGNPYAAMQHRSLIREMARYEPGYAEIRTLNRPVTWGDVHRLRERVTKAKQRASSPCSNPPDGLIEHPDRLGKWGRYNEAGRFVEEWRFDPAKPGVKRGHGKTDHIHLNGSDYWIQIGD